MYNKVIKSKYRPSLWFGVALLALSILSIGLYYANYNWLAIAAKRDQTPLIQQRNHLLKQENILQSNWLKTLNPLAKKIQGDLIWSNQLQTGFMRFSNLPKLSTQQSYHLWIYDLENSIKEPISANYFQADPHIKEEFIVKIIAEQTVKKPYKFVLTLESKEKVEQILLLVQP